MTSPTAPASTPPTGWPPPAPAALRPLPQDGNSALPSHLQLWLVDLDAYAGQHSLVGLPPDERQRAERFAFEHLKRRSLASRHALRRVLGETLGRSPHELPLAADHFGKPRLVDDENLHFNLSHREKWALIGLQRGAALGVDLELARPLSDQEALAQAIFSTAERAGWQRLLSDDERRDFFFNCWTRKEACVKALGVGMSAPLPLIDVGGLPLARTLRLATAQGDLQVEVRSVTAAVAAVAGSPDLLAACAWADAPSVARAHAAWG